MAPRRASNWSLKGHSLLDFVEVNRLRDTCGDTWSAHRWGGIFHPFILLNGSSVDSARLKLSEFLCVHA